ncbi:MAG TPA: type VI secretion system tip protein TssI/VgrG [Polyangium sp.]|nr:type VI secretion system tip protein TssI/VgrG [Polyangium sp.]
MSSNQDDGSSKFTLHGDASLNISGGVLESLNDGPDDGNTEGKGDAVEKKKLEEILKEKKDDAIKKAQEQLGPKIADKAEDWVKSKVKGFGGELLGEAAGIVAHEVVDVLPDLLKKHPKDAKEKVAHEAEKLKGQLLDELPVFSDIAVTASSLKNIVAKADAVKTNIVDAAKRLLGQKNFEITIGSGDALDVRNFSIHERLSSLFQINLVAVSDNQSIDFDSVVGQPAKFAMSAGMRDKFWTGICNHIEQVRHEPGGLSTYHLSIVPRLWLLTQRKNYRMHQQISEPDIVLKMLQEWGIEPVEQYDKGSYKKRKYRVQYNESDYAFMCRMLEDAGITFYFKQDDDAGETKLVLSDAPQSNQKREPSLLFRDDASLSNATHLEFVTEVRLGQRVRPGKYTMRDHDYRKPPTYKLMSEASKGLPIEEKLERFQYVPGAFLFGADSGEATPHADDKGKTRTDEKEGKVLAQKRLDAKRGSARTATFETNAHDLAPGVVMGVSGHGHEALGEGKTFLVVEASISGTANGEWSQHCEVRGTEIPFRPELVTPRPKTQGVESATVVGPPGQDEIHCDEFGRVRVHFHWDRESKMDDNSSCWIHVSQPWGGTGYGGTNLPRIGQEVLVDFLGGDPDRPIIVGRVYTGVQTTPYKLPANKTQSGWKSNSTGGGGGYNEIMFEDAKGKELVNMQAEKDLKKLVKNDETVTIGRHRTKLVKANDGLTVGGNRTKRVVHNENASIGMNKTLAVGINRSTQVGQIDSTMVGDTHVVTISPSGEGLMTDGSTSFLMKDKKIVLDTGAGAKITMDGASITLSASTITIQASAFLGAWAAGATVVGGIGSLTLGSAAITTLFGGALVNVSSGGMLNVNSSNLLAIASSGGDVKINGGPMVKVNM